MTSIEMKSKDDEDAGRTEPLRGMSNSPNNMKREQSESFVQKQEKYDRWLLTGLVWAARMTPVVFALGGVVYVVVICGNSENWESDENDDDTTKYTRVQNRGTLVSLTVAVLLNLVGWFMYVHIATLFPVSIF